MEDPIVEIPNNIRNRVYQPLPYSTIYKQFTPEFFTLFSEQIRQLRPTFTPVQEEYIIRFDDSGIGNGIGLLSANTGFPPDIIIALDASNDNLVEDVRLALRATFDQMSAQAGGKRKSRKLSHKGRKNKKSRKAKKTRGRK